MWFRRTGRGGAANGGKGPKSKLIPMGLWLQRRIIWMCGFDWEEISAYQGGPDDDPGLFPIEEGEDMMFHGVNDI
eukprot:scaffold314055_cov50-Attheya_sp.AAC.2